MPTAKSSTVMKAFSVLSLFRSRPLMGAAECARLLDMPPASAHRMLMSLAEAGALEATSKGQYRLSLHMFELGHHVPYQRWLFDAAYLPMETLVSRTRLSAHLAVRDGVELMYLVKLRHAPDRTKAKAGDRNSLHATANGKMLLAHATREVVADVLCQDLFRFTPYTITTRGRLCAQLERIRTEGFAYDHEERTIGLVSIAVPINDHNGTTTAALSLLAPVEKYRQSLQTLQRDLSATKRTIELNLIRTRDLAP